MGWLGVHVGWLGVPVGWIGVHVGCLGVPATELVLTLALCVQVPPLLPKSDIDPEHCRVLAQLDDNVSVVCVRDTWRIH